MMYLCLLRATAVSLAMLSMLKSENCVGEVGIHVGNFANLAIFARMHCRAARFFVFCSADALRTGRVCRLQGALHGREDGGLAHRCRWQAQAVLSVEGIASHYVGPWLRTEYNTAVIRAHNAADWLQFECNRDILPNLRWMPTTSPNPEAEHKRFWSVKLTRPIDDPFWNKHRPGDRWNCKCSLEATDEPPTDIPDDADDEKPQRGLRGNPAKTGQIFDKSHPYFPEKCRECGFNTELKNKIRGWFANAEKDCNRCKALKGILPEVNLEKIRERRKYILKHSNEVPKEVGHPEFTKKITISKKAIKEWTNQPHGAMLAKNKLILSMDKVLPKAKYLKDNVGTDYQDKRNKVHLFYTPIQKVDSWIIVKEYPNGEFKLHSVSDNASIIDKIKS